MVHAAALVVMSAAACGSPPKDGGASAAARSDPVPDTAAPIAGTSQDSGAGPVGAGATPPGGAEEPRAGAPPATPPAPASAARRARGDSVRGIVAVVGAEPNPQVVVRAPEGTSVRLTGVSAGAVGRASGAEVVAWGTRRDARTLEVSSYAIRSVDGVPATDGTLAEADGRLVLVAADGTRRPIVSPPTALRAHVGARVWISGAPDQEPQAFGVLEPK